MNLQDQFIPTENYYGSENLETSEDFENIESSFSEEELDVLHRPLDEQIFDDLITDLGDQY
ncbi:hypothetical protein [Flammeovirga agarivorans]|uniref:Uncharacterized protein n=1 Tax=Flammeovirga agarivorans TaxID=2726742 RepID=A0A7X8XV57_9BACT|nr:hypothetical protein [Flammeovirga agarivorans]NLR90991.1 hypothetical protein [Flammeovirga agarivorans]